MVDQLLFDKMVGDIKQARKLLYEYREIGIPAIERCLRTADMNLHYALWLNGEACQYQPDLPLED